MFGWLKGSGELGKLEKQYDRLLKEAQELQQRGKLLEFGQKTAEAEKLWSRIESMRAESQS